MARELSILVSTTFQGSKALMLWVVVCMLRGPVHLNQGYQCRYYLHGPLSLAHKVPSMFLSTKYVLLVCRRGLLRPASRLPRYIACVDTGAGPESIDSHAHLCLHYAAPECCSGHQARLRNHASSRATNRVTDNSMSPVRSLSRARPSPLFNACCCRMTA